MALHFAFGGLVSYLSGSSFTNESISAGANELLQKQLMKKTEDPGVRKLLSVIIGKTVSNSDSGSGLALSATTNNGLMHIDQYAMVQVLSGFPSRASMVYWLAMSEVSTESRGVPDVIEDTHEFYGQYSAYSPLDFFSNNDIDTNKGLTTALW